MSKHSLKIFFDEDTEELKLTHICATEIAGHNVSVSEEVNLEDKEGSINTLKSIIEDNREEMEKHSKQMAITHVAAVTGKVKQGVKTLKIARSLSPSSTSNSTKIREGNKDA